MIGCGPDKAFVEGCFAQCDQSRTSAINEYDLCIENTLNVLHGAQDRCIESFSGDARGECLRLAREMNNEKTASCKKIRNEKLENLSGCEGICYSSESLTDLPAKSN